MKKFYRDQTMIKVQRSLMVLFEPGANLENMTDWMDYRGLGCFKNCFPQILASLIDARERLWDGMVEFCNSISVYPVEALLLTNFFIGLSYYVKRGSPVKNMKWVYCIALIIAAKNI